MPHPSGWGRKSNFGTSSRRDAVSQFGLVGTMGVIGVALLLIAFFLNLFYKLSADSWIYLSLNVLGAALSAGYALFLGVFPFVVLEGIWASFAAYRMAAVYRKRRGA
jgi:hypothetical protein